MSTPTDKLESAKSFLGKRYLLHPENKVKRLRNPLPETSVLGQKASGRKRK